MNTTIDMGNIDTETRRLALEDEARTAETAKTMTTAEAIKMLLDRIGTGRLGNDRCVRILTDRILSNAEAQATEIDLLARNQQAQANHIEGLETLLKRSGIALCAHSM